MEAPPANGKRKQLREWDTLLATVVGGKHVGDSLYLHVSALPPSFDAVLERAVSAAGCPAEAFNVVKLSSARHRVSLLSYPGFFSVAFPLLADSWTVDLESGECEHRCFRSEANPPVLHRKELLLSGEDPQRGMFEALTSEAERLGLFADTAIIGHRIQWEEELRARGLRVVGHELVTATSGELNEPLPFAVARHKTAIVRRSLSTPMHALWRHGFLDGRRKVFDYGCGRGDDVAALKSQGIDIDGWDPYYRQDGVRSEADVVNLGFVLNVIEDPAERRQALVSAFGLARHVLSVSALIGGRTAYERHRLFRDGVLTSVGTFQKYFTHSELGSYIADVLRREPVAAGPGLYFVFRTDEGEQDFLEKRQRSRWDASSTTAEAPMSPRPPASARAPRPRGEKPARTPRAPKISKWEQHADLVDEFWKANLSLGRTPLDVEFPRLGEMTALVGTPKRVISHLLERYGESALESARKRRCADLSVFLAQNLFEQRRSFGALSRTLQTDIREFWGSYPRAATEAKNLLFSLRDQQAVALGCVDAAAHGFGFLVPDDSLCIDARLINELPSALRVYIGCGSKLYGDVQEADVVKIHISSGKLSVMSYDDYEGSAIPMLIERVKIDLRRQDVHFFQYGEEFPPQPLYFKSRYMHPSLEGYEAQRSFDQELESQTSLDWNGFGPPLADVLPALARLKPPDGLALPRGTNPAVP